MKIGQKVFDKEYGEGIVRGKCGDIYTISFTDKVRYYYENGTELGSRMRGDRQGALLDVGNVTTRSSGIKGFIRRWLSRTA
jgi:hypothetical protein